MEESLLQYRNEIREEVVLEDCRQHVYRSCGTLAHRPDGKVCHIPPLPKSTVATHHSVVVSSSSSSSSSSSPSAVFAAAVLRENVSILCFCSLSAFRNPTCDDAASCPPACLAPSHPLHRHTPAYAILFDYCKLWLLGRPETYPHHDEICLCPFPALNEHRHELGKERTEQLSSELHT